MAWKKVSNSDAGDSSHFGGDDIDKISDTFNAGTQTDPINIKDVNLYVVDPADTSKKVRFDVGDNTSSSTRIVKLPNADVTLASTTAASTSVAGLMSAADKSKLDLIEASATADQTGGQIKTLYQAETNAFTDTLFTKLNAIEASADVTDTTNVNAAAATTVGTITSGTWQGTTVAVNQGGTGTTTSTGTGSTVLSVSPTLTGTVNAAAITLSGDLTVNGTSTTVNTSTLSVEDPLIKLASGNNAADSVDVGFYGLYDVGGTDKYSGIVRDASDGKFIAFKDLQTEPTTTVDKTATGYTKATIVADIEGNADTATTVSANAIGITQLAGIPRGKIIVGDASGDPALLAVGAEDTVLTVDANGDVGWEATAQASPLTTKGDIYAHNGTTNVRLAASTGTDGKALKLDSSTATGLAWGDAGGSAPVVILEPSTSTTYRGTGGTGTGTGITVGTAVGTEAAGVGQREIYIRKIDTNNEGVFTVIHKNGAAVEVQIA